MKFAVQCESAQASAIMLDTRMANPTEPLRKRCPLDQTTSDKASARSLIWTGWCDVAERALQRKTRPDAPVDWVTVHGTFGEQDI